MVESIKVCISQICLDKP